MALGSQAVARISVRVRALPLAFVIPATDVLLLTSIALTGLVPARHGFMFGASAFLLLDVFGPAQERLAPRIMDEAGSIVGRMAIALLLVAPLARSSTAFLRLAERLPFLIVAVLIARAAGYRLIAYARAHGYGLEPTLILGAGPVGATLATTLVSHPEYGLLPVGFADRERSAPDEGSLPVPMLGSPELLLTLLFETNARRLLVADPLLSEHELVSWLRAIDDPNLEIHVVPRLQELGSVPAGPTVDDLWGIPIVRLRRGALRSPGWRVKRLLDIVLSSALLIAGAIPLGLIAIAVKLSSPGPVLFRQKRVCQRGEVFEILKFRTMLVNDDSDTTWSVVDDERQTAIGRLLRHTHVDELPQLFNVLRGEMSLVGPRPERPQFVDRFSAETPRYADRHRVPPGLTGWSQVHGLTGDTSIEERARFDNRFIEDWSLWQEFVILIRTFRRIV